MGKQDVQHRSLGAEITRASSKQTYYTIKYFADGDRTEDAYRAYGYFRWVDDILDTPRGTRAEKSRFIQRQRDLLEASYRREALSGLCPEEQMLADMVAHDTDNHPGLRSYLENMMAVMEFDAKRRGHIISQAELDQYTHWLAVAVTDALFYFIGHDDPAPDHPGRYDAVTAAHITHMLRDTYEDTYTGYYNISRQHLEEHYTTPHEKNTEACKAWVSARVRLAHQNFKRGRKYIGKVKNFRCRLAGYAYAARFEWVLRAIERDNFCLRLEYAERKSLPAAIKMSWYTLVSMLAAAFS